MCWIAVCICKYWSGSWVSCWSKWSGRSGSGGASSAGVGAGGAAVVVVAVVAAVVVVVVVGAGVAIRRVRPMLAEVARAAVGQEVWLGLG